MKALNSFRAMLVGCVMAVWLQAGFAADEPAAKAEGKFVSLFNGKDLAGWHGDSELWKVVDGVIVGSTDEKQLQGHNSFLIYDKPLKNFVIKAKFKLRNHNSGIQFRSKELPDFVCQGYQADMAETKYTGSLYEEKGRGVLVLAKEDELKPHLKADDWNEYIITANGPNIKQEINGFTTVDYAEKDAAKGSTEGILALQLHAGQKMKVEFKDIELLELP